MSIIEFKIHVDDPVQKVAIYDRIQVHKSATKIGSYVDITADEATAAVVSSSLASPWDLDGETLDILLDGGVHSVVFSGTNPMALGAVLDQINAVVTGLASEIPMDTGRVRLTSLTAGTQSSIHPSGSAIAIIGYSDVAVSGKNARLLLSANTEEYLFRDYNGLSTDWYKVRLYSSETGAVSDFGDPFMAGPGSALGASHLVVGSISLADTTGAPITGRRIILVPVSPQVVIEGDTPYGVLPSIDRVIITTDLNGQASTKLVKGQRLKVFIEGSTFQREFVVPTTDFDILQVASVQPDPLDIVQAPPMPTRVS